jgi:hypothetical protein
MARKSKKQIILLLVDLLKPILRLDDWTIKVQFVKIASHRADCEANPEYKEAVIRFDVSRISTDDLIPFVVHEMLHCVIWRLAHVAESFTDDDAKLEWSRIEEEYLTTQLEQIIVPMVSDRLKAAIKIHK